MYNLLFILALIIIGYVVREDGMNDIKRAFNLELFVIARGMKEKKGRMKEILTIKNEYKDIFFRDERKTIADLTGWIHKKIRLKGRHK